MAATWSDGWAGGQERVRKWLEKEGWLGRRWGFGGPGGKSVTCAADLLLWSKREKRNLFILSSSGDGDVPRGGEDSVGRQSGFGVELAEVGMTLSS